MIGRIFAKEFAGVRRSPLAAITLLLAAGGAVLARTIAWIGAALERSEVREFLALASLERSDFALPLALLAYVLAAGYLFGRDFDDGTIDYVLTSPVPRESIVVAKLLLLAAWVGVLASLAWVGDAVANALLAATSIDSGAPDTLPGALLTALAAFATLPVVGWAAVRLRGTIPALGVGVAIQGMVMLLGGVVGVSFLPWHVPVALATAEAVSPVALAAAALLFVLGAGACMLEMRRIDLV